MQGRALMDGPVSVDIELYVTPPASWSLKKQRSALLGETFPTAKPDMDNVIKGLFDACNEIVWKDDKQVVQLIVTKRYAETANSVRLPSYQLLNLSARYELCERVSMYGDVDNVTNSLGLSEGNPRAGELASSDAGASAFIARPLLGRNYRLALMYRF